MITDKRIVEIIKGYIAMNSDNLTRPDMNSENHLLALVRVVLDDNAAQAAPFKERYVKGAWMP